MAYLKDITYQEPKPAKKPIKEAKLCTTNGVRVNVRREGCDMFVFGLHGYRAAAQDLRELADFFKEIADNLEATEDAR